MVTRERRAPIRQHAHKPALRNVMLHVRIREVGMAQPLSAPSSVEHDLALHAHVNRGWTRSGTVSIRRFHSGVMIAQQLAASAMSPVGPKQRLQDVCSFAGVGGNETPGKAAKAK